MAEDFKEQNNITEKNRVTGQKFETTRIDAIETEIGPCFLNQVAIPDDGASIKSELSYLSDVLQKADYEISSGDADLGVPETFEGWFGPGAKFYSITNGDNNTLFFFVSKKTFSTFDDIKNEILQIKTKNPGIVDFENKRVLMLLGDERLDKSVKGSFHYGEDSSHIDVERLVMFYKIFTEKSLGKDDLEVLRAVPSGYQDTLDLYKKYLSVDFIHDGAKRITYVNVLQNEIPKEVMIVLNSLGVISFDKYVTKEKQNDVSVILQDFFPNFFTKEDGSVIEAPDEVRNKAKELILKSFRDAFDNDLGKYDDSIAILSCVLEGFAAFREGLTSNYLDLYLKSLSKSIPVSIAVFPGELQFMQNEQTEKLTLACGKIHDDPVFVYPYYAERFPPLYRLEGRVTPILDRRAYLDLSSRIKFNLSVETKNMRRFDGGQLNEIERAKIMDHLRELQIATSDIDSNGLHVRVLVDNEKS